MTERHTCCFILPQVVLLEAAERGSADLRRAALNTIAMSGGMRSRPSFGVGG